MKQLYIIVGKRKAGTTFLFNAVANAWQPSSKDVSWDELKRQVKAFSSAQRDVGVLAKADALLDPQELDVLRYNCPYAVTCIYVDRNERDRFLSFVAHERRYKKHDIYTLREKFREEEEKYNEGLKTIKQYGLKVKEVSYDVLKNKETMFYIDSLCFIPLERKFNSRNNCLPFFSVISAVAGTQMYQKFKDTSLIRRAKGVYYFYLAKTYDHKSPINVAVLGSVEGPVDGQRRLTKRFVERTAHSCYVVDFNRHRSVIGPVKILWQFITLLVAAKRRPIDVVYVCISRSRVGLIRDAILVWAGSSKSKFIIGHVHGGEFGEFYLKENALRSLKDWYLGVFNKMYFVHEYFAPKPQSLPCCQQVVRNPIPSHVVGDVTCAELQSESEWRFAYLAGLVPGKGIEWFVDAAKKCPGNSKFFVAGGVVKKYQRYGQERVNELRETEKVEYLGAIEDVKGFLGGMDFIVFLSVYESEAVPLAVLEALEACVIPIMLDREKLRAVFEGAPVVWLSEPSELRDVIDWYEKKSTDSVRKMKEHCRLWVRTNFPSEEEWKNAIDEDIFQHIS